MTFLKKLLALAIAGASVSAMMLTSIVGQETRTPGAGASRDTVTISDAQIEAVDISEVAARIDGVLEAIEIKEGTRVRKGDPIGYLYRDRAELAVKKAKLVAESRAPYNKADAEYNLRLAHLARARTLIAKLPDAVSKEEVQQKEAEVRVAHALREEAIESKKVAETELEIALQTLREHTVAAPFDGDVIERLKRPGEAVHANEPVVRMINLDRIRIFAYVPYTQAHWIRNGDPVEVIPNLPRTAGEALLRYRGKITFVDYEVQAVNEKSIRIYAEVDNKAYGFKLRPGLTSTLVVTPGGRGVSSSRTAPPSSVDPTIRNVAR